MIEFNCLRCGKCCRDLLVRGGIAGLMLFPNEVKVFQKKDIKPCLAIGKSTTHGSFKIITYQLTEDICSHFKDDLCTIYQERPLTCKSYPFRVSDNMRDGSCSTAPECTFIKELREKTPEKRFHEFAYSEDVDANIVLREKLRDFFIIKHRKNRRWAYDLKADKWKLYQRVYPRD